LFSGRTSECNFFEGNGIKGKKKEDKYNILGKNSASASSEHR